MVSLRRDAAKKRAQERREQQERDQAARRAAELETLRGVFAGRPGVRVDVPGAPIERYTPPTPLGLEQERLDASLAVHGAGVGRDEQGRVFVTFAQDVAAERDEALFGWPERRWIETYGVRRGLALADAGRIERAQALADGGRLTAREVEHLHYLATAPEPLDSVAAGTVAITTEQARALVEQITDRPQRGRPDPTGQEPPAAALATTSDGEAARNRELAAAAATEQRRRAFRTSRSVTGSARRA